MTKRLTIPATVPDGIYRLLACADDRQRAHESRESNNCIATRSTLTLGRAVAPSMSPAPIAPLPAPTRVTETPTTTAAAAPSQPAPVEQPPAGGGPTGAPASVSLAAPADGAYVTSGTPTFSGSGGTSSFVTVTVKTPGGATVETLQTLPASDGSWSVPASPALPDGSYGVSARQTGPLGDTATTPTRAFTVDTVDPSVTVTLSPSTPNGQNGIYSSMPTAHVTSDDTNFAALACTVDGSPTALVNQPPASAHDAEGDVPVAGDGSHTVSCAASDRAGRRASQARDFQVQSTAPIVALVHPTAGTVTSSHRPAFDGVAGHASGDLNAVTVKIYPGSSASGTPVQTLHATASATDGSWSAAPGSDLAEGTYTAQAEQSNSAGAVGKSAAHTFTVDVTAPTVTVSLNPASPNGLNSVYKTIPTVHVTADDANYQGLSCTVDGSAKSLVNPPANATHDAEGDLPVASTDGHHSASCTGTDDAGNSTTQTRSFDFDGTAPSVSLSNPASNAYVATGTPTFDGTAGTASNDNATVSLKLSTGSTLSAAVGSGGAWSVAPSAALADGSYTAHAEQTDRAGNLGQSSTHSFTVDTTNPTLSLTLNPSSPSGQNGYYSSMPTVHAIADDTNFQGVSCTVDGTTKSLVNQPSSPTHSAEGDVPVAGDGSHTVSCTATDKANHSVTQSKTFKVDTSAPSVSISSPASGSTSDDQTVTIAGGAGSASDDSGSVTVKVFDHSGSLVQTLTGARGSDGSWSVVTQALPVGTYSVRAEQTDSAGNTGVSGSVTFSTPAVMLAAGDIASCDQTGDTATAALLGQNPSDAVVALGDNAYEDGSSSDFNNCYGPTWGAYKSKTHPAVGNHEYATTNASGYFGYFGSAAGTSGQGWYSYDLGTWHVVVLNTSDQCWPISCAQGSAQEQWLKADLQAHATQCTLAYWHHPLFTSDGLAAAGATPGVKPLWNDLYAAGAEVVLNGHAHQYERFAPETPDGISDPGSGIREFVSGTGGYSEHPLSSTPATNSIVRNNDTFGVLRLVLRPGGYSWRFIPQAGKTFTDSGSASCH